MCFLTLLILANAPFKNVTCHTEILCLSLKPVSIKYDQIILTAHSIVLLSEELQLCVSQKFYLNFRRNSQLNSRALVEEYF